jgi:TP901 family phage tail tape measure protein
MAVLGTADVVVRAQTKQYKRDIAAAEKAFKVFSAAVVTEAAAVVTAIGTVGMKFESTMATVGGVMRVDEMSADFGTLKNAAMEWGSKTEWSANQAASALKYMGMAGMSAKDAASGLPGVLNLATAGSLELAEASDIVTDTMTAMGMKTSDLSHLNDVMVGTITRANTDIRMMGETFKYVAPVASTMGVSLEDLSAMTGVLANAGIKASDAGTDLRQALVRNIGPSKELGTAQNDLVGTLRAAYKAGWDINKLKEEYGLIALKSVAVLMRETAEVDGQVSSYTKLRAELSDVTGESGKLADRMRDTVEGAFNSLKSTIEGIALKVFYDYRESAKATLNTVTDFLRDHGDMLVHVAASAEPLVKIMGVGGALMIGLKAAPIAINLATAAYETMTFAVQAASVGVGGFNTVLNGTAISATYASGALGKVKIAAGALFAAFAGWEIGKYLYDEFEIARHAGLALVAGLEKGWINVKYYGELAWTGIKNIFAGVMTVLMDTFAEFTGVMSKAANALGADEIAESLALVTRHTATASKEMTQWAGNIADVKKRHEENIATHERVMEGLWDESRAYDSIKKSSTASTKVAIDDGKTREKAIDAETKKMLADIDKMQKEAEKGQSAYTDNLKKEQEKRKKSREKHGKEVTKIILSEEEIRFNNWKKYMADMDIGTADHETERLRIKKAASGTLIAEERATAIAQAKALKTEFYDKIGKLDGDAYKEKKKALDDQYKLYKSALGTDQNGLLALQKWYNKEAKALDKDRLKDVKRGFIDTLTDSNGDYFGALKSYWSGMWKDMKNDPAIGELKTGIIKDFSAQGSEGVMALIKGDTEAAGSAWDTLWDNMLAKVIENAAAMAIEWGSTKLVEGAIALADYGISSFTTAHEGEWNIDGQQRGVASDEVPIIARAGEMILDADLAAAVRGSSTFDEFAGMIRENFGMSNEDMDAAINSVAKGTGTGISLYNAYAAFKAGDNALGVEMLTQALGGALSTYGTYTGNKTISDIGNAMVSGASSAMNLYNAYQAFEHGDYATGTSELLQGTGTAFSAYGAQTGNQAVQNIGQGLSMGSSAVLAGYGAYQAFQNEDYITGIVQAAQATNAAVQAYSTAMGASTAAAGTGAAAEGAGTAAAGTAAGQYTGSMVLEGASSVVEGAGAGLMAGQLAFYGLDEMMGNMFTEGKRGDYAQEGSQIGGVVGGIIGEQALPGVGGYIVGGIMGAGGGMAGSIIGGGWKQFSMHEWDEYMNAKRDWEASRGYGMIPAVGTFEQMAVMDALNTDAGYLNELYFGLYADIASTWGDANALAFSRAMDKNEPKISTEGGSWYLNTYEDAIADLTSYYWNETLTALKAGFPPGYNANLDYYRESRLISAESFLANQQAQRAQYESDVARAIEQTYDTMVEGGTGLPTDIYAAAAAQGAGVSDFSTLLGGQYVIGDERLQALRQYYDLYGQGAYTDLSSFQGHAKGGVVDQAMIPSGEDGWVPVRLGESVLTEQGTRNLNLLNTEMLSTGYRSNASASDGKLNNLLSDVRRLLERIASASEASASKRLVIEADKLVTALTPTMEQRARMGNLRLAPQGR